MKICYYLKSVALCFFAKRRLNGSIFVTSSGNTSLGEVMRARENTFVTSSLCFPELENVDIFNLRVVEELLECFKDFLRTEFQQRFVE